MHADDFLIVSQTVVLPTFGEHFASVFAPFTIGLWFILATFTVVFGVVLGYIERGSRGQLTARLTSCC